MFKLEKHMLIDGYEEYMYLSISPHLHCWQRFPIHVPIQRHTPGCMQVPPFRQGGLQTAAI